MVQDSWRARRGRGTTVDTAIVSLGRIVDGLAMETPTQVAHSLLARGLPHIEAVAAQPQPGHAFNPPGRGQAPAGAAATCVGDSSSRLRLECCGAGSSVQMLFLYSYLRPHPHTMDSPRKRVAFAPGHESVQQGPEGARWVDFQPPMTHVAPLEKYHIDSALAAAREHVRELERLMEQEEQMAVEPQGMPAVQGMPPSS